MPEVPQIAGNDEKIRGHFKLAMELLKSMQQSLIWGASDSIPIWACRVYADKSLPRQRQVSMPAAFECLNSMPVWLRLRLFLEAEIIHYVSVVAVSKENAVYCCRLGLIGLRSWRPNQVFDRPVRGHPALVLKIPVARGQASVVFLASSCPSLTKPE